MLRISGWPRAGRPVWRRLAERRLRRRAHRPAPQAGSTQVDCPKSSNVVEGFTARKTTTNSCATAKGPGAGQAGLTAASPRYRLKLLKSVDKALSQASKVSIRMNGWGVLSMQFLVHTAEEEPVFIEFLCMPRVGEEED